MPNIGIMASRIAQAATQQAIRTREQAAPSETGPAADVHAVENEIPLDHAHLPMSSPTTRGEAAD